MSEKKRKYLGKTVASKLEVIREADEKERSKSEITQTYEITLSTVLMYITNRDSVEQQALKYDTMKTYVGVEILLHHS
jgi:hypothetical protein